MLRSLLLLAPFLALTCAMRMDSDVAAELRSMASPASGLAMCVINGPDETGLSLSFGVKEESCRADCFSALYERKIEDAFVEALTPVPFGDHYCACEFGSERKVLMKLPKHRQCQADEQTKSNCWRVYKALIHLERKTNVWTPSATCQACDLSTGCDSIAMPINIDSEQVRALKERAAAGEPDAVKTMERIAKDGSLEDMVLLNGDMDTVEALDNIQPGEESLPKPDDSQVEPDEGSVTSDVDEELEKQEDRAAAVQVIAPETQSMQRDSAKKNQEIYVNWPCTVTDDAAKVKLLWRTWTPQSSTCGSIQVASTTFHMVIGGNATQPPTQVQLRCYAPDGSVLLKQGEEGVCRIPRKKACIPGKPGCRPGTICAKKNELMYVKPGYFSSWTCTDDEDDKSAY